MLVFAEPPEICLEISPQVSDRAWQSSHSHVSPPSRWRAYLNRLGLETLLPWVQQEYAPEAQIAGNPSALVNIWEVADGSAITLGDRRAIIISSEALDEGELSVPQEWVDIPGWAGDYYLALHVNSEAESVRVWGWTTHAQLKATGTYDPSDRTYNLPADDLIQDLSVLWLSRELCPEEVTRARISPLPSIPAPQVETLCQRLGNPEILTPRLEIPFSLWGALLENEEHRERLYRHRLGRTPQNVTRLSQWFANLADESWRSLDSLLSPAESLAWRFRQNRVGASTLSERAKCIELALPEETLAVILLLELKPEDDERVSVRVQLHPEGDRTYLPPHLELAFLGESGEILKTVASRDFDNYIQLPRFKCSPGYRFSLQVKLDEFTIRESFEL